MLCVCRRSQKDHPWHTVNSVCPPSSGACREADYHVETFEPDKLLALLKSLRLPPKWRTATSS